MILVNKVILLTGGSSGIGLSCAEAYLREGAHLTVVSNNEDELRSAEKSLGSSKAIFINADVSNESAVQRVIEQTVQQFNRIDAIHNNAGIVTPSVMLHKTTTEEWTRLMDVNLKSIYFTTRYGLEHLIRSKGSILNTSSMAGVIGQEEHAAYAATKGGINALTKSMALDYSKFQVRVNSVNPAWVWTGAVENWVAEQPDREAALSYINTIHPLGGIPGGEAIADACVFLVSDYARFITGCLLPVSGGAELGYRRVVNA